MAQGKYTLPKVIIPKGIGWHFLCTGARYVQNIDEETVPFAFGDTEPTIGEDSAHRMSPNVQYVNDAFDSMWIYKNPHKEFRITITHFGES